MRIWIVLAAAVVLATVLLLPRNGTKQPFGFSREGAARQSAAERRLTALPDPVRIADAHRVLTSEPHPAGSLRDRQLAEWTADQFRAAGMKDVTIITHDVLMPRPLEISVEMGGTSPWSASFHEPPIDATSDTDATGTPAFHAYSASGDVSAPVIYAGDGRPEDYDWLAARGIEVKGRIALVRHSPPYSYRGFKTWTAQQRGAAAVLMFSDPSVTGAKKGAPYPDGPWGPDALIERGSVAYDFLVPGDPQTPGWPSTPGAERVSSEQAVSLPSIASAPLSAADARVLMKTLGGPAAPVEWQGGLGFEYAVGPGATNVSVHVRMAYAVRPVWTVTGVIRGEESPDDVVILGNHRDAWVRGGVDPSSGSAVLIELARSLGELARQGWKPRRSIMFASWDAEELALISSTEWGEQHEAWLDKRAVAYINLDTAVSGTRFAAAASPSLRRLVVEAAEAVRDPEAGIPVAVVARDRLRSEGSRRAERPEAFVTDTPGGGSDYTVFLHHLGIPVVHVGFEGPYGVYHSAYDTHAWVARHGDPGFLYHAALARLVGIMALRLAGADVLPVDPSATASSIAVFLGDIERRLMSDPVVGGPEADGHMEPVRDGIGALTSAAAAFEQARSTALTSGDADMKRQLNQRLLVFERDFLHRDGLQGRPWYRHLVHAPAFTYAPVTLPGLSEAIEARDNQRLAFEAARLAKALRQSAAGLAAALFDPEPGER
jgi:N-acetylated-alpha-linked acidic dipeptidase